MCHFPLLMFQVYVFSIQVLNILRNMTEKKGNTLKIYRPGDKCYVVENRSRISEATVIRRTGSLYLLRLGSCALRLPCKRLYPTREAAEASLPEILRLRRHENRPPMPH